jgi:hypothetical protein
VSSYHHALLLFDLPYLMADGGKSQASFMNWLAIHSLVNTL